jgi:hypothetical protein
VFLAITGEPSGAPASRPATPPASAGVIDRINGYNRKDIVLSTHNANDAKEIFR